MDAVHTFVQGASAKVEAQVGLRAENLAPLHELVRSKLVGLGAQPGKLGASGMSQSYLRSTSIKDVGSSYREGRWSLGPTPSSQW